jgi:poly-gamma-glutamate capsule biosynthesis protein CapA/YwtB (metallophosphatase superfamily)
MMGTNYPSNSSLPPDDGRHLFDSVRSILLDADITAGNLEGPLLNSGGTPKRCQDPTKCFTFRMPERYIKYLKDAGYDFLNTANNHGSDMGAEGRNRTMEVLRGNDIAFAGFASAPTAKIIVKGLRIGFASFSPCNNTPNINDHQAARTTVVKLKKECDIVIVSMHAGAEGSGAQHITKQTEMFLGENRGNVYRFAHEMIDAGADMVFGHGPHVTRAVEKYKNRFIAYSLGNFCTYGKFGLSGPSGVAPIIKVNLSPKGEFLGGQIFPIKQINKGFPVPDEDKTATAIIRQLTREDIPNPNIVIADDGMMK